MLQTTAAPPSLASPDRFPTSARHRLAAMPPYLAGAAADRPFWQAMREAISHHLANNAAFRRLSENWEDGGFSSSIERLPFIHVNVFKTRVLLSVAPDDIVRWLSSSGTTGQTSQNPLDKLSEQWHLQMLESIEIDQGLRRPEPCDLLWLMLHPQENPAVAAVYSCNNLAALTPLRDRFFAMQGGGLQVESALRWLAERSGQGVRLRVVGLCPFLLKLLEIHEARGGAPFSFHPDSYVLTGGGWKAAQAEAIPRETFIARISRSLGIPAQNLRDHFGMVEHAVLYPECSEHRQHVPTYARVLIRHPGTLAVQPAGEAGLLQVITPMVQSVPAVSILTTDWASLDETPCRCGRPTPTLSIRGRAGINKNRGCAITAAEICERT